MTDLNLKKATEIIDGTLAHAGIFGALETISDGRIVPHGVQRQSPTRDVSVLLR